MLVKAAKEDTCSVAEAARLMGLAGSVIRQMMADGLLDYRQFTGHDRPLRSHVAALVADRRSFRVALTVPLPPMPKKRPRFGGGRVYNDAAYLQWRREFVAHCRGAKSLPPGAFGLTIRFVTPTGRMQCDIDNAQGAVLDALQDAEVIVSDRYAVDVHAWQAKGSSLAIEIELWLEEVGK